MRRLYPNPFSGRPAPIELTSCFLLSPTVFLKLLGVSMSAIWKELGKESVIKSIEYHRRRGQPPPTRLCNELLAVIPADTGLREELARTLDAIERGDETELGRPTVIAAWADFLAGYYKGRPVQEYSYANRYLLALEAAFVEPGRLIQRGEFAQAARALVREELTRPLLSPEMSFALAVVTSKNRFKLVQWAITLEASLSHLAAWSASLDADGAAEPVGDITPLFAEVSNLRSAPGPQFFRFLMHTAKQESMMELVRYLSSDRKPSRIDINVETLKRWSAGKTLPEQGLVKLIARKCCPGQEERLLNMHWAARYLTLLGHVSETLLTGMERHRDVSGASELFAPWPTFPYGYESFESWCQNRFPFWFRYHEGRLAAGDRSPAAS